MGQIMFYDALKDVDSNISKEIDSLFSISNLICKIMKLKNINYEMMSEITGYDITDVKQWLNGSHNFTIRELSVISNALDYDIIKINEI